MKKDWIFSDERSICSFRTTGVLMQGNKILVQREKGGNEYALPGGHVKTGETSIESLIREYKEETGADIIVNRLIWIEEVFWKWNKKEAHTLAFYFLITPKDKSSIPDGRFASCKDNCNVLLEWVALDKLSELIIYPSFIKEKIKNISEGIEHFISKE